MHIFAKFIQINALELCLKPSEASQVAREVDINGDGYVDFTEFAEKVGLDFLEAVNEFFEMTTVRKVCFARALSLSTKVSRQLLPRRQQTDATRETLDHICRPPPIFLAVLAILEVGVFFYQQDICGHENASAEDGISICLPNAVFAIDPNHPFQLWRYLTNVLVHYR